jgi:hypothetical protein
MNNHIGLAQVDPTKRLNALDTKRRIKVFCDWEMEIIHNITHDDNYVLRATTFLWGRQTAGEQISKKTIVKNHVGLSASDARRFSKMAEQLEQDGALSAEDIVWCRLPMNNGIPRLARYRKQLRLMSPSEAANLDLGRKPVSSDSRLNVGGELAA